MMPAPAAAAARPQPSPLLTHMLSGGDRRSIAQANRVCDLVVSRVVPVAEVVRLTSHPDPLVAMRAFDVLEKIAHADPQRLRPHRAVFLGRFAESERWEVRLQIVRALPRLPLTASERARATQILLNNLDHPQPFVRAWALDGLAAMARRDRTLNAVVTRQLARFERSSSAALRARARHIRRRWPRRGLHR